MFRNLRLWLVRRFLKTYKFRRDDTILIAVKSNVTENELEEIAEFLGETLGDNVALVGGVDKVVIVD